MCGIAGILSLDDSFITKERLQNMTDSISHRGPDGEGHWINANGNVGFGHRRLSVIDLSAAASQPMHYLGRYFITYNGEIYNYIELRQELLKSGYHFSTQSDTEVILAAYDCWREKCLQHFDGMFALAIWDEKEQMLFAARDRFGEKPFYYYQEENTLIFASEMKALWVLGVEKKVDNKMMLNYLTLGHLQNPNDKGQTFFENIFSLPPSSYLSFNIQLTTFNIRSYWDIDKETEVKVSPSDAIETFGALLTNSVNRRLRSDITVGTSLSGGLDSSSVVSLISSLTENRSLKTFSAVFPGFEKDESSYIRSVVNQFNIENFTTTPTESDLIRDFEKLCYHQEEPFSSSSIYAQFRVFQLAKEQNVKVLLDGQGADETLAGYNKYIHWYLQQLINRVNIPVFRHEKKIFTDRKIPFRWGFKNYVAAMFPSHVAILLEKSEVKKTCSHPDISKDFVKLSMGKEQEGILKPAIDKLNDILYFNTMHLGLEELLRFADRNAMAHGVEVRLPFLQYELVEFLFSISAGYKMHEGWTKWLLRKTMEKNLPPEIVWRTDKVGYEPPQQQWMRNPVLQEYMQEAKRKLIDKGILNKKVLDKKITPQAAHEAGNFNWRYLSAAQIL
jgi:asparagine synthase (glutamine-hydrolysing)